MSADLQVTLALQGDLEKWARNVNFNILTGLKGAAEEEGRVGLEMQRDAIRAAGLGDRVANAQRLDMRPSGSRLAYSPTVFLYSRAAHIIEAFANAEPLRGHPLMAVPIPDSPAASISISRGQSRTEAVERKFGKLRVVPLKGGGLMLVAQGRADSAGGVRALVKRRDKATGLIGPAANQKNQVEIPMFWLVPQVRLGHPLPWLEVAHKIQSDYRKRVEGNLRKRLNAMTEATAGTADWKTMPAMMMDDMGRAIPAYTGPKDLWGSARAAWIDQNGG
jgi:hypothetical protein